ncbi:MAG: hypothetical protein IIY82_05145, partial [Firmicutes bacterium]|nr:hypothetical protein [Bacillota bacterium]
MEDRGTKVTLAIYKGEEKVAETDFYVLIAYAFDQLFPLSLPSDLDIGWEIAFQAQVSAFDSDHPDGVPYENVRFYWHYDENAVEIWDASGNPVGNNDDKPVVGTSVPFRIHRLREWGTDIFLEAAWLDQWGNERWENRRYHLDEKRYELWFEDEGDKLYDDGTLEYRIRTEGLEALQPDQYEIRLTIGTREGEDWTQVLTPGEDYTYADGLIVLNGAAIKAKGLDHLELHAELFLPGLEEAYRDDWRNCQVREAYTDYWPEQDRDMLPGWRQTIDCWRDGRIENSRNIDGRDFRYRVTDVRSSDPNVVEIEKKYENEDPNAEHVWWDYIAQGAGEAEITVEYTIIGFEQNEDVDMTGEPETGSFTFRINVGGDVYRVDLWTEDGSEMALPGDTVTLLTHGWHDFLNEEGQQEGTDEGLVYEWELEDWCSEFAELMPDPQDPQQARLTLNVPEEIEGYHQEVWVKVHLFDGADEMTGETLHRAENRIRIEVNSEYPEVWPAAIDGDLDMGCRMMIWPELRYYRYGEDGYETRPAHYRWYYDPNAIEIFDQDGNRVGNNDENGNYIDSEASAGEGLRFTVHRLTNWDTDIDVDVDWADPEDPNWERHEHRHYHLNQKNYNIWWERDPIEVYDDWHVTVPLNQEELGMLPRNLVVEAGVDPQENGSWYYKFEEGSVYTWDGNAITIKGPALYELLDSGAIEGYSVDSLREGRMVVGALLFYPPDSEEGILLNMNWTGINLKEACPTKGEEHRWYEEVLTPATCEETGELYQKCIKCGEERWTPIPPTGHKIVKVAAKAPTLTAYGNTEHYKCSVCGKLFSDAAGTKPTTAAKVRIAKLIDIAQASVAGLAAKTYNGKAQTQSLTLTYGGKTLAAGTDYTLNYKNNTAAGTATVTMTGKGLYGGSAQKTFKINP